MARPGQITTLRYPLAGHSPVSVAAPAEASPQADTKCSSMAMPNDSTGAGPSQLNPLTRAAQVNASNQTPQAPPMDMTC